MGEDVQRDSRGPPQLRHHFLRDSRGPPQQRECNMEEDILFRGGICSEEAFLECLFGGENAFVHQNQLLLQEEVSATKIAMKNLLTTPVEEI